MSDPEQKKGIDQDKFVKDFELWLHLIRIGASTFPGATLWDARALFTRVDEEEGDIRLDPPLNLTQIKRYGGMLYALEQEQEALLANARSDLPIQVIGN